jgi:predicted DNA-binding transcriptional regulator AlpA
MIHAVDRRYLPLDTERVRIGDAARILGVHVGTLRQDRAHAFPRPIRIGSKRERRYAIADLRAYLERGHE